MTTNRIGDEILIKLLKAEFLLASLAIGVVALLKHNLNSITSAVFGLVLVVIPTMVYAKIAFKHGLVVAPNKAFASHKKAMVYRFIANLVLFGLVVVFYRNCDFIALLITYFAAMAGYWVILIKK